MFLAQALNSIKNIEQNGDRQQVLAKTLKNPEKLAKTLLRIEFLTACRPNKICPRFIEDALRPVNRIFRDNQSASLRCERLSGALLNDAISEAHRTKAYLIRERDRLASTVSDFLDANRLTYVHATCQRVFDVTFRENRPRLQRKFHARMHQETQVQQTTEEENEGETAAPKQKKINNLSSLELGEASLKLLSKGPNFALTQKITESVILEAEKRVERLAGNGDAITVSVPSRPASTNTDTGRVDTTRVDTESSVLGVTQQLPGNNRTPAEETARSETSGYCGPTTAATETGGAYPGSHTRRTTTEKETATARQNPTQSGYADARPATTAIETGRAHLGINTRRTTTETETATARQIPTQSGHANAGPTTLAFAPPPMPGAAGVDGATTEEGTAGRGSSEHRGPTTTPAETGIAGVDTGGATAEAGMAPARRSSTQWGLSFRFASLHASENIFRTT